MTVAIQSTPIAVAGNDTEIDDGKCFFFGAQIVTDGTNDATLNVWDGTKAGGTLIFSAVVTGAEDSKLFALPFGLRITTSLTAEVDGTGSSAYVFHRR